MQRKFGKDNNLLMSLRTERKIGAREKTEEVQLKLGDVILEPYTPVTSVYFPSSAMISLLSVGEDGSAIEVAVIGNEGLAGVTALLGRNTVPYRAIVQAAGAADKIACGKIQEAFDEKPLFRKLTHRYLHLHAAQITQSGICNSIHSVEQRLARWLLSYQDRAGTSSFPYTHEFLAGLIGTRRETITQRLQRFHQLGWIYNSRSKVTILNRRRLEMVTCECYLIVRAEYESYYRDTVR